MSVNDFVVHFDGVEDTSQCAAKCRDVEGMFDSFCISFYLANATISLLVNDTISSGKYYNLSSGK